MRKLILFVFVIVSVSGFSQNVRTSFHKDINGIKEVSEKKANFKKITTTDKDGTYKVVIFEISTGQLRTSESYSTSKTPVGVWLYYNSEGKETSRIDYANFRYSDKKIEGAHYFSIKEEENTDLDFTPAKFNYENADVSHYIAYNLRYPNIAKDNGIQGEVVIHIKIGINGNVEIISIYKGVHSSLDLEVYKLFSKMPIWSPAIKDGKPIDSYTIIPVNFKLF